MRVLLDNFIHVSLSAVCGEETQILTVLYITPSQWSTSRLARQTAHCKVMNVITAANVTYSAYHQRIYMTVDINFEGIPPQMAVNYMS